MNNKLEIRDSDLSLSLGNKLLSSKSAGGAREKATDISVIFSTHMTTTTTITTATTTATTGLVTATVKVSRDNSIIIIIYIIILIIIIHIIFVIFVIFIFILIFIFMLLSSSLASNICWRHSN
ncbi:hypothetical protein ACLKA7_004788 [Drosophila subpalustris]